MEYYIRHIDEYSGDTRQGNEFAPKWPFRMLVSGSSDSGKTTMLMNLLMGNKEIKEDGERYILCNDVILIAKHLNEPKWSIVKDFFDKLAEEGEDVSFKSYPAIEIPDPEEFNPNRATVVIFEDLMNAPKKIQGQIADYFSSGRHSNISPVYVSQRFFLTPKTIRENVTYISLHRGAGSLADIKRVISLYGISSDKRDYIASAIEDITRKNEFIVFDLRLPSNEPLSMRIRWDTSFWTFLNEPKGALHNYNQTKFPITASSSNLDDNKDDPKPIPINLKSVLKQSQIVIDSKFNSYGQNFLKNAKINGSLIDIARELPPPEKRKKMLAEGVRAKNSTEWARYVYREAFNIKDKRLGPDWIKFANKLASNK